MSGSARKSPVLLFPANLRLYRGPIGLRPKAGKRLISPAPATATQEFPCVTSPGSPTSVSSLLSTSRPRPSRRRRKPRVPAQTTPAQTTPAQTTPAQTTPVPAQTTPGGTTSGQNTPIQQPTPTTNPTGEPSPLPTPASSHARRREEGSRDRQGPDRLHPVARREPRPAHQEGL